MKQQPLIERHWMLIRRLGSDASGATVRELAQANRVSEKTVRRDLQVLRQLGFPLNETNGKNNQKHWKLAVDRVLPAMLRWDEAAALYVGQKLMRPLAGTCVADSFESLSRKIEAALSDLARQHLDHLANSLLIASGPLPDYGSRCQFLDDLQRATEDRRLTWITYQSQSSTEPVTYDVHPYGIVFAKNSFYLIAYAPHHGEIRHYKLDRISDVTLQGLKFQKQKDFNLEQHLAHTWGIYRGNNSAPLRVQVRFAPEVARYVQEKRWHPSQRLAPQPDGSVIAEFELSATEEFKTWILSFGPKAEVLEPKSLRQELARDIEQFRQIYRSPVQRRTRKVPR